MFEYFDYPARDVIKRAKDEAAKLNHSHIDTPHLFLAIIGENSLIAQSAQTSHHAVRTSIEAVIGVGERPRDGYLPFTEELNETLRRSINLTMQRRHFPLTPLHLCVSMLQNEQDVIHGVLQDACVDVMQFRKQLERQLANTRVWSPFHIDLPPVVALKQHAYWSDEILLHFKDWRPLDTI